MANSFTGWGGSWSDSWGTVTIDPNAMRGSAAFSFTAGGMLTSTGGAIPGEMSGGASLSVNAVGSLTANTTQAENPRYAQAIEDHAHWRQLREEDDVLFALLQQFVMEEA